MDTTPCPQCMGNMPIGRLKYPSLAEACSECVVAPRRKAAQDAQALALDIFGEGRTGGPASTHRAILAEAR